MLLSYTYTYRTLCLCLGLVLSSPVFGDLQSEQQLLCLMTEQLPGVLDSEPLLKGQFYQVIPLTDGGPSFINSVYQIDLLDGSALILKLENSVWKNTKTCNEVSAIKFLKENSSIPVPQIIKYCDNLNDSPLKNEFIIMKKLPGKPLNQEIDRLYSDKHKYYKVLDQLASILAELKTFNFSEIGNFLEYSEGDSFLQIGGIVDFANFKSETSCKTYSDYAKNAIRFYIQEMEFLASTDSQDKDIFLNYIPILKQFIEVADFTCLDDTTSFVFSHQDFVMKNILVDDDVITAVLDWEWSGSALLEIESLTGFDFLFNEADQLYFAEALKNHGAPNLFGKISKHRETFYQLIGNVYTLVAVREWQEHKLEHTAKFLSQKLQQRQIRNSIAFDYDELILKTTQNLDQCIAEFLQ